MPKGIRNQGNLCMRKDIFKGKYYCTSFCNFTHRLTDGMPVNHECYQLIPKGLLAEMAGDYSKPINTGIIKRGIKREFI